MSFFTLPKRSGHRKHESPPKRQSSTYLLPACLTLRGGFGALLPFPSPTVTFLHLHTEYPQTGGRLSGSRKPANAFHIAAGQVGKLRHGRWITARRGAGSNPASASSASRPPFLRGIDVLLLCTKWLVCGFTECKVMEREIQSQAQLQLCYRPIWKGKCSAFFFMPTTI